MLCKIYRLRNFDRKLSADEKRETECVAEVEVDRSQGAEPFYTVTFTMEGMRCSFEQANVLIKKKGFMVGAQEHGPINRTYLQVWYCLPVADGETSPASYFNSRLTSRLDLSYESPIRVLMPNSDQAP